MAQKESMIMLEFDLSGAEWVVVAYLANDANMIGVIRSGKSPHVVTGSLITGIPEELVIKEHELVGAHTDEGKIRELRIKGDPIRGIPGLPQLYELEQMGSFLPRVMAIRQAGKKSNHGLNYNMKYRRFALENEITEADALPLVEAYTTKAYPGIPIWHKSIVQELRENNRCLTNCFGRKVRLMGEWGNDLFDQAYSFKPQSTIGDLCLEAMYQVYHNESQIFRKVVVSAQTHDSFMVQHPIPTDPGGWADLAQVVLQCHDYMTSQQITYGEHTFSLGSELKVGLNWGDMDKVKVIPDDPLMTSLNLHKCVAALQEQAAASSAARPQPETPAHPAHLASPLPEESSQQPLL